MLYRTLKPLVPSRITSLKHCLSAWVSWHYGRLRNKSTERKFYIRVKPAKHLMQASVAWRPQSPFRLLGMGRGAQGGRVDIHTAPKFWSNAQNLIMYVTRKLCPVSSFFFFVPHNLKLMSREIYNKTTQPSCTKMWFWWCNGWQSQVSEEFTPF